MRRAVSEFPNDNPELHDGLVWSVPSPCAPALPTLRLRAQLGPVPRVMTPSWVAPESAEPETDRAVVEASTEPALAEPVIWEPVIVESAIWEPAITEFVVEFATDEQVADEPPPAPPTPFAAFVAMLARVALERGATRAAACLPGLFGLAPPSLHTLDSATLESLRSRAIVQSTGNQPTPEFSRIASAWRDVLEGTAGDLARCGSIPLDAWAAGILGALLNAPRERSEDLRRELRKRGVAAFGLLAAA